MERKRLLTGDRTTGKLHLGHLAGSLQNRVRLQEEYDTFILLADVQALTTHFHNPERVREGISQVALDNLSVGLAPEKTTLVQQSRVPAIAELTVFYSMLVSVNVLRHNPTIKTEARQYGYDELSYGFLGYPVSQAADITFVRAELVPVGEDQLPHLEQTRKIVRRFNDLYGEVLTEPRALLGAVSRLPGLDGNAKMGKSLGNAVYLSDDPAEVACKIKAAVTDPARVRAHDPGHPEVCAVQQYHRAFNPARHGDICEMCRAGTVGCAACKQELTAELNRLLDPIRERRGYYEAHMGEVCALIEDGSRRAQAIGIETVDAVKQALRIDRAC